MELLERRPVLPAWRSLPEPCRREVSRLLTQLLREHVQRLQPELRRVPALGAGEEATDE
jgi:hypothetical protein